LVNKQGQTRLAKYYEDHSIDERLAIEGEVVRKCLGRSENQVLSFCDERSDSNFFMIWMSPKTPSRKMGRPNSCHETSKGP
jgi:hypothetical protein